MASELRKVALESEDIGEELHEVKEWGITVLVKGMTAKQRARLLKKSTVDGILNMEVWFPDLVIATTYDPKDGEKVFVPADRDALNEKSGAAIAGLADVAARLSGLGDKDVQESKEELQDES